MVQALDIKSLLFLHLFRWKTLDAAALKLSSVSFFEEEKHETAVSKWSRARTRAAKVLTSIPQVIFYVVGWKGLKPMWNLLFVCDLGWKRLVKR